MCVIDKQKPGMKKAFFFFSALLWEVSKISESQHKKKKGGIGGVGMWILSTSHNDLNNTGGHKNSVWYGDTSAGMCVCVCAVGRDYEEQ